MAESPIIVGRLTRSLPRPRPYGMHVYDARLLPTPFCETPRRLTQTPYRFRS